VIAAGKDGQVEAALALGAQLVDAGLRVLVDDRPNVSAGVKFTDAELIGIPRAVVVGRRSSEGYGELRDRRTGERHDVPLAGMVGVIVDAVG
jgi:prolyl-tRNA synthetase